MKANIGFASRHQIQLMYERFYPEQPVGRSQEFAERVLNYGQPVSMAQIQGYFMLHKSEPLAAIDDIQQLWTL